MNPVLFHREVFGQITKGHGHGNNLAHVEGELKRTLIMAKEISQKRASSPAYKTSQEYIEDAQAVCKELITICLANGLPFRLDRRFGLKQWNITTLFRYHQLLQFGWYLGAHGNHSRLFDGVSVQELRWEALHPTYRDIQQNTQRAAASQEMSQLDTTTIRLEMQPSTVTIDPAFAGSTNFMLSASLVLPVTVSDEEMDYSPFVEPVVVPFTATVAVPEEGPCTIDTPPATALFADLHRDAMTPGSAVMLTVSAEVTAGDFTCFCRAAPPMVSVVTVTKRLTALQEPLPVATSITSRETKAYVTDLNPTHPDTAVTRPTTLPALVIPGSARSEVYVRPGRPVSGKAKGRVTRTVAIGRLVDLETGEVLAHQVSMGRGPGDMFEVKLDAWAVCPPLKAHECSSAVMLEVGSTDVLTVNNVAQDYSGASVPAVHLTYVSLAFNDKKGVWSSRPSMMAAVPLRDWSPDTRTPGMFIDTSQEVGVRVGDAPRKDRRPLDLGAVTVPVPDRPGDGAPLQAILTSTEVTDNRELFRLLTSDVAALDVEMLAEFEARVDLADLVKFQTQVFDVLFGMLNATFLAGGQDELVHKLFNAILSSLDKVVIRSRNPSYAALVNAYIDKTFAFPNIWRCLLDRLTALLADLDDGVDGTTPPSRIGGILAVYKPLVSLVHVLIQLAIRSKARADELTDEPDPAADESFSRKAQGVLKSLCFIMKNTELPGSVALALKPIIAGKFADVYNLLSAVDAEKMSDIGKMFLSATDCCLEAEPNANVIRNNKNFFLFSLMKTRLARAQAAHATAADAALADAVFEQTQDAVDSDRVPPAQKRFLVAELLRRTPPTVGPSRVLQLEGYIVTALDAVLPPDGPTLDAALPLARGAAFLFPPPHNPNPTRLLETGVACLDLADVSTMFLQIAVTSLPDGLRPELPSGDALLSLLTRLLLSQPFPRTWPVMNAVLISTVFRLADSAGPGCTPRALLDLWLVMAHSPTLADPHVPSTCVDYGLAVTRKWPSGYTCHASVADLNRDIHSRLLTLCDAVEPARLVPTLLRLFLVEPCRMAVGKAFSRILETTPPQTVQVAVLANLDDLFTDDSLRAASACLETKFAAVLCAVCAPEHRPFLMELQKVIMMLMGLRNLQLTEAQADDRADALVYLMETLGRTGQHAELCKTFIAKLDALHDAMGNPVEQAKVILMRDDLNGQEWIDGMVAAAKMLASQHYYEEAIALATRVNTAIVPKWETGVGAAIECGSVPATLAQTVPLIEGWVPRVLRNRLYPHLIQTAVWGAGPHEGHMHITRAKAGEDVGAITQRIKRCHPGGETKDKRGPPKPEWVIAPRPVVQHQRVDPASYRALVAMNGVQADWRVIEPVDGRFTVGEPQPVPDDVWQAVLDQAEKDIDVDAVPDNNRPAARNNPPGGVTVFIGERQDVRSGLKIRVTPPRKPADNELCKYLHKVFTFYVTTDALPGPRARVPVVRAFEFIASPVYVGTMDLRANTEATTRAHTDIAAIGRLLPPGEKIDSGKAGPLTQKLTGSVLAFVNGGPMLYSKSFFSAEWVMDMSRTEDLHYLHGLDDALTAFLDSITVALTVHRTYTGAALEELQVTMDGSYISMRAELRRVRLGFVGLDSDDPTVKGIQRQLEARCTTDEATIRQLVDDFNPVGQAWNASSEVRAGTRIPVDLLDIDDLLSVG